MSDLGLLVDHTHKFESRYLDGLVGTDRAEMKRRSPLYSADQITVPVILLQGLDDKVVPPEQAEAISAALSANEIPHAHLTYEGRITGSARRKTSSTASSPSSPFTGKCWDSPPTTICLTCRWWSRAR